MSNKSDTVYEYKKVKPIDMAKAFASGNKVIRIMMNKINELCIEQNHLMKDFELYKKAFKQFVTETNRRIGQEVKGVGTGTSKERVLWNEPNKILWGDKKYSWYLTPWEI